MIRALIVDGDRSARESICRHLSQEADIEIIGDCGDGDVALEMIGTLKPDVVFIEVEIPAPSAFELLRSPHLLKRPYVIITTASDKYAMEAFDASVTDYLLKPVEYRRLKVALVKLRSHMERDARLERRVDLDVLVKYLQENQPQKPPINRSADRVPVKFGRRYRFVNMAAIRHIAAEGDYVNIHMATGEVLHSGDRISEIERKLPPDRFLRVHRSVIINIEHVREVRSDKTEYDIVMNNGQNFKPGTTYRTRVKKVLISGRNSHATELEAPTPRRVSVLA